MKYEDHYKLEELQLLKKLMLLLLWLRIMNADLGVKLKNHPAPILNLKPSYSKDKPCSSLFMIKRLFFKDWAMSYL